MPGSSTRHTELSYHVGIIGAGKVGSAVARLLRASGCNIECVISKTIRHARTLAIETGAKCASISMRDIPPATDFIVIATGDSAVTTVAESVAKHPNVDFRRLTAIHCSGALTRDALAPLRIAGARTMALHPAFPFASRDVLPERLKDIGWAVECDTKELTSAKKIIAAFGGNSVRISPKNKILYHAGCAIASNFLAVLSDAATRLCHESGLTRKETQTLLQPLMRETLVNVFDNFSVPFFKKLTGAAARGDSATIEKHLDALKKYIDIDMIYRALTEATLELAKKRK